jgi:O-methyltransferase involved in polyketide biosynthesis
MYLTDDAVRSTLADIASCSVPGSVVVLNYHEPADSDGEGGGQERTEDAFIRLLLSLWQEPQIGLRTPEKMRAIVERSGLVIRSDTPPSEWAARLGTRPPQGRVARISRLLVAERASGTDATKG